MKPEPPLTTAEIEHIVRSHCGPLSVYSVVSIPLSNEVANDLANRIALEVRRDAPTAFNLAAVRSAISRALRDAVDAGVTEIGAVSMQQWDKWYQTLAEHIFRTAQLRRGR